MEQTQITPEMWGQAAAQGSQVTLEELEKLLAQYKEKKIEIDKLREEKAAKENEFTKLQTQVISAMEALGKTKVYVEGEGTAYFIDKLVVTTPKTLAEKQAFFAWLEKTYGKQFLLDKLSVNHQTLQKIYNDAFAEYTERAKDSKDDQGVFSVPGLNEPTNMRSLGFRKENN